MTDDERSADPEALTSGGGGSTLTDDHYNWMEQFCGIDARPPAPPPKGAAPGSSGGGMSAVSAGGGGYSAAGTVPPPDSESAGTSQEDDKLPMAASPQSGGGRGDPPAEELDGLEGKNRDGSIRNKAGDGGMSRGRNAKRDQDRIIDRICQELGLNKDQRRRLHDEITGQNLTEDEIRRIGQEIKNGSSSSEEPESSPVSGSAAAPDSGGSAKISAEHSPDWQRVAEAVAVIGLSVALIATIVVAVADPEPASKLATSGLALVEIRALGQMLGFATP